MLEKVMTGPGATIATKRRWRKRPPVHGQEKEEQTGERHDRSRKMQPAAEQITMLREIKRVKLRKGAVGPLQVVGQEGHHLLRKFLTIRNLTYPPSPAAGNSC